MHHQQTFTAVKAASLLAFQNKPEMHYTVLCYRKVMNKKNETDLGIFFNR